MVKDIIAIYRKHETILIKMSVKRYFSHLKINTYLKSSITLKGTATLMITMFYTKDLNKP